MDRAPPATCQNPLSCSRLDDISGTLPKTVVNGSGDDFTPGIPSGKSNFTQRRKDAKTQRKGPSSGLVPRPPSVAAATEWAEVLEGCPLTPRRMAATLSRHGGSSTPKAGEGYQVWRKMSRTDRPPHPSTDGHPSFNQGRGAEAAIRPQKAPILLRGEMEAKFFGVVFRRKPISLIPENWTGVAKSCA